MVVLVILLNFLTVHAIPFDWAFKNSAKKKQSFKVASEKKLVVENL